MAKPPPPTPAQELEQLRPRLAHAEAEATAYRGALDSVAGRFRQHGRDLAEAAGVDAPPEVRRRARQAADEVEKMAKSVEKQRDEARRAAAARSSAR